MPDVDQVRAVVNDALRRRKRLPVSTTSARKAKHRLGYAVSVEEVHVVLQEYAQQGKLTLTETTSGDLMVTNISAAFLSELPHGED